MKSFYKPFLAGFALSAVAFSATKFIWPDVTGVHAIPSLPPIARIIQILIEGQAVAIGVVFLIYGLGTLKDYLFQPKPKAPSNTFVSWINLFIVSILGLGIPSLYLGRFIWPNAPGTPLATSLERIFTYLLYCIEALAFGIGVNLLIFGWRFFRTRKTRSAPNKDDAMTFIAIIWLLVSWWAHDNFHRYIGEDVSNLLFIEYEFHVTAILAAMIIAHSFWKNWTRRNSSIAE